MRTLVVSLFGLIIVGALGAALMVFVVMPRMNWNATAKPGTVENFVANRVIDAWVQGNAEHVTNPVAESPENLRAGEDGYDEHCAVCHGLDGSARNLVKADFYPPVPRLARGVKDLSDGEVYFIVANGIRMTGMPGYGVTNSSDEIWHIILWVRHFPNLTAQEKAAIDRKMKQHGQTGESRQEERSEQTEAPAKN